LGRLEFSSVATALLRPDNQKIYQGDFTMRVSFRLAACLVASLLSFSHVSSAQMADAAYVVTYIEVTPASTNHAIDLLQAHVESSRAEDGNTLFHALRRIGRPNHFALVEAWENQDAQAAHAGTAHTQSFRSALEPLLYSPYDERPHSALMLANSDHGDNPIYGLTHVDVIPTGLDAGHEYLQALVDASRTDAGNIRFDVLTQISRQNHMTLVESWDGSDAQATHSRQEHSKTFRAAILTLSGSLYDERLYRRL
jgi:quinol monooxygenase YgiN